jgi:hypothetical protein
MLKQVQKAITQSGATSVNNIIVSTTARTIITSVMVQTAASGYTVFSRNGETNTMLACISSGNISNGNMTPTTPIFMLGNTLTIITAYPDGSFINVIVNYIDASADNPVFSNLLFDGQHTKINSAGQTQILSNSDTVNYNIKSIYAISTNNVNELTLLLSSTEFPSPIAITNSVTGQGAYNLLSYSLLLKINDVLYLNTTTSDDVDVYVSYTAVQA